jgi:hypothetical protein
MGMDGNEWEWMGMNGKLGAFTAAGDYKVASCLAARWDNGSCKKFQGYGLQARSKLSERFLNNQGPSMPNGLVYTG